MLYVINDYKKNNIKIEKEKKIIKYYYKFLRNKEWIFLSLILLIFGPLLLKYLFDTHKIIYYDNNNIKYDGRMINGKYDGYGISYYKNGNIEYNGTWSKNKKEGKGILYYDNKENSILYNGTWDNDKKDGEGLLYYENGKIKYNGKFRYDEYHKKENNY